MQPSIRAPPRADHPPGAAPAASCRARPGSTTSDGHPHPATTAPAAAMACSTTIATRIRKTIRVRMTLTTTASASMAATTAIATCERTPAPPANLIAVTLVPILTPPHADVAGADVGADGGGTSV